jgi:hypothetical protein
MSTSVAVLDTDVEAMLRIVAGRGDDELCEPLSGRSWPD